MGDDEKSRKLSDEELEELVIAHEHLLYGRKDPVTLLPGKGVLVRLDEYGTALNGVVVKIDGASKLITRWGIIGGLVTISLLVAIITKEYGIIPAIIGGVPK